MAFDISVVRNQYGAGEQGSYTPTGTNKTVNEYAAVTSISGRNITLANSLASNSSFVVGACVMIHVAAYNGTKSNYALLGARKFAAITAIDGATVTVTKNMNALTDGDAGEIIQMVFVPHFSTVTLNEGTSITCPQFNGTTGGIVAFKCSEELIFNGGHINLNGKGIPTAQKNLRPYFQYETDALYSGYENYKRQTRIAINSPDGAAVIIAKKITGNSSSRIGNPDSSGTSRVASGVNRAAYTYPSGGEGGANLLLVAETFENFSPKMISKTPSVTSGGKGIPGCYIATESVLPCDEGLYAYDRILTPGRMTNSFKITDFGSGSDGTPSASKAVKQMNSYAVITEIDKTRKILSIGNFDSNGINKITKDSNGLINIPTGTLVMVRSDYKGDKSSYKNNGRFILARVVGCQTNKVIIDTAIPNLSKWNMTYYNFQLVTIPQFTNYTLAQAHTKTPAYKDGMGGVFAIAVKETCDLSGGVINLVGKGGCPATGAEGLDYISNAQMAEKLPIGEGNGSVFILADNLILNSDTRLGGTWSGAGYGGNLPGTAGQGGGWKPTRSGLTSGYSVQQTHDIAGTGARGGECKDTGEDFSGGYNSNSMNVTGGKTQQGAYQGAHILIIADKIAGLSVAALSTGGDGGSHISYHTTMNKPVKGEPGGCGFGGGSGYAQSKSPTANYQTGGSGGYIGGGAGVNNSYANIFGGGSGAFCFIYCNSFSSQNTSYLTFS